MTKEQERKVRECIRILNFLSSKRVPHKKRDGLLNLILDYVESQSYLKMNVEKPVRKR